MGMYTELVVSAQVKDVPEVIEVLRYMARQTEAEPALPDHPLFKCDRWTYLFTMSSYYFVPRSTVLLEFDSISKTWCLISRADLKNYDDEIENFVDWIRPYIARQGEMFAYSRYEENREPTIYYSASEEVEP